MINFKEVSVIIPAFNEEKNIGELLRRIFAVSVDFEVIVCSDGSSDKTALIAREKGAQLVEHPYNVGNGASVISGALKSTREYLVFMDADLQHQPEDIAKLLEYLPDYDMVVGARTKESKTLIFRNFGNFILKIFAENIIRRKIPDLTSGFRALKKSLFFKFRNLYPLGYSYPTTITMAFFTSGYFVKYVALPSIIKRNQGASNIRPMRDGLNFIYIIYRITMTFNPLRIFFPIALFFFVGGLGISVFQIIKSGGVRSTGIILIISSVVIILNGMLAEQISLIRRNFDISQSSEKTTQG